MPAAAQPQLTPGQVYRTRDLAQWGQNAPRLAQRLVREGLLRRLRQGVYEAPLQTRFGPSPAADAELVRAFLGTDDFLFTGSPAWNALGLGATGVQAVTVVYNKKRTGEFKLGNRTFQFRRVAFPSTQLPSEWFAVDLLRHHADAGVGREQVLSALVGAVRDKRLDGDLLMTMANEFGRPGTVATVAVAVGAARRAP